MNHESKLLDFIFYIILICVIGMALLHTQSNQQTINIYEMENSNDYLNIKSSIVYFSRPTCPTCQEFEKNLKNNLKDIQILYFNTDRWREDENFSNILSTFNVNTVPVLLKVQDGKEVDRLVITENSNMSHEIKNFFE